MEIGLNESRCTGCMLCVKDCTSLVWEDVNGMPAVVAPENCNRCSHCLAVCPADAITHKGLDRSQVQKTERSRIDPGVYEMIARGRRSVRRYKTQKVPREVTERILDLVRHSPTATNSQNVGYIVISDKEILKRISNHIFGFARKIFSLTQTFPGHQIYRIIRSFSFAATLNRYLEPMPYYLDETEKGRDFILHNAPVLIVVHAPKNNRFSNENCNISACNMMNYAYSLGLGTCYIGFLTLSLSYSKKLRKLVKLPDGHAAHAAVVMGYPAYRHSNTASRKTPEIHWE